MCLFRVPLEEKRNTCYHTLPVTNFVVHLQSILQKIKLILILIQRSAVPWSWGHLPSCLCHGIKRYVHIFTKGIIITYILVEDKDKDKDVCVWNIIKKNSILLTYEKVPWYLGTLWWKGRYASLTCPVFNQD